MCLIELIPLVAVRRPVRHAPLCISTWRRQLVEPLEALNESATFGLRRRDGE